MSMFLYVTYSIVCLYCSLANKGAGFLIEFFTDNSKMIDTPYNNIMVCKYHCLKPLKKEVTYS